MAEGDDRRSARGRYRRVSVREEQVVLRDPREISQTRVKPSSARPLERSQPRAKAMELDVAAEALPSPALPSTALPSTAATDAEETSSSHVTPSRQRGAVGIAERISTSIDALGRPLSEAPPRPRSVHDRARAVIEDFSLSGPGDEGPGVQQLLHLPPEVALREIALAFPGLLWFHRTVAHRKLPDGREIGPLGAALVAFGRQAVDTVVSLLASPHHDRRYYAALVAHDLFDVASGEECVALASALGERLFDVDAGAQDAALHALLNCGEEGLHPLSTKLRAMTGNADLDVEIRITSLRALGVLRVAASTQEALSVVDHPNDDLRIAARQVLRLLAAVDFGSSQRRWRSWWKKNQSRSRVRWLLDGLLAADPELRELAARELGRLAGENLEFNPLGRRGHRKAVRAQYAELLEGSAASL